jgi:purine nucleosidase/pyrimidine-specific ribonucleoside hydrolase
MGLIMALRHERSTEPIMKKKIIIDCDVGVDDALALILSFHSPELEVLAVKGVNGNVSLDRVMINIRRVLSLLRPSSSPWVAGGAGKPLRGKALYAESLHGEDGVGGAGIQVPRGERRWQDFPGPADELLTRFARQYGQELTLIAVGPLTNLALALQRDPEGMKELKEVVIMGGAVRTGGNVTPHAEFNFYVDPLAAKIVLESGLPITLVPLDATHQVPLTPQLMEERVKPLHNPFSQFVIEATRYDPNVGRFPGGRDGFYLHDPLAVGTAILPGVVKKENLFLLVETGEGEFYGQSREVPRGGKRVGVCLRVDRAGFLDLFLSRLKG